MTQLPIMWKLIVSFVLAILTPMTLTTLVSLKVTSTHLEQQLKAEGRASLRHAQNELSRLISSADSIAEFLSDSISLHGEVIKAHSERQYLEFFREFSSIAIIEIFDNNKELIAQNNVNTLRDSGFVSPPNDSILEKALNLEKTTDYFSHKNGIAIKVATPIVEMKTLDTTGVIVVTIPINSIFVQDLKSRTKADIAIQWNASGDIHSTFLNENGTSVNHIWENTQIFFDTPKDKIIQQQVVINNQPFSISSSIFTADNGKTIGILSTGLNAYNLKHNKESLYKVVFISSTFFLIIAILIGIALSRTFTRPITKLKYTMTQVAEGDLNKRVTAIGSDEIGDLSTHFNQMTDSLQRSFTNNEQQKIEIEILQNYLSNIINSMPSVLIGIDAEGRITQWNKQAEIFTGIGVNQALQHTVTDVFPQMASRLDTIQQSIKTRTAQFSLHERCDTQDGEMYQNVTIYPLITNGTDGAVIRIDDVTKEHNMALQLSQSRRMDAIGELAGGIAHDFNNMLMGILGAAEILEFSVDEKTKKPLKIIISAAQRAADLTSKLLTFSRQTNIELSPTNIQTVIIDAINLLKRTLDKAIVISCSIKTDRSVIMGNDSQLQNVLLNIGINAAHAMDNSGKLDFHINNVTLSEDYCADNKLLLTSGNFVAIEIKDTGSGIPPHVIKRIFEPFYTTKELGKGTGLGLASAYGIIQEHHGAIKVTSDLGYGATFTIYLPETNIPLPEAAPEEKMVEGSETIMLVDDEKVIRETSSTLLEHLGYNVVVAKNGQEAIKLFKPMAEDISLVILDMIMPRMSGTETFHKLKEIRSDIKIVISSGFTNNEDLTELRQCGLAGDIQKPYSAASLSQLLAKVLSRKTNNLHL